MTGDEQEGAKVLIARDEQKKLKRQALKNGDDRLNIARYGQLRSSVTNKKKQHRALSTKKTFRSRINMTNGEGMATEC
jgi:hypothetical protein